MIENLSDWCVEINLAEPRVVAQPVKQQAENPARVSRPMSVTPWRSMASPETGVPQAEQTLGRTPGSIPEVAPVLVLLRYVSSSTTFWWHSGQKPRRLISTC